MLSLGAVDGMFRGGGTSRRTGARSGRTPLAALVGGASPRSEPSPPEILHRPLPTLYTGESASRSLPMVGAWLGFGTLVLGAMWFLFG